MFISVTFIISEQVNLQFGGLTFHPTVSNKRRSYGLLAIDGGGSRGIIAARILQHLASVVGRPLWKVFNYGAGVSTGGLLILTLLVRRTAPHEFVPMYKNLCGKIFARRLTRFHEYPVKPLERELQQHFCETRLTRADSADPCVFVVTKRNYEPEPFLLRNYDISPDIKTFPGESGWLCWEAARATSAAPTFFPAFKRNNIQYSDGAMGFDNPVLVLFKEVLLLGSRSDDNDESKQRPLPKIDFIVSIGTGKMDGLPEPTGGRKKGFSRVVETVQLAIESLTDFENSHNQMQMLAEACNIPYFRFNPELPERCPLDIRRKTELDELVTITDKYLSDENHGVRQQIERFRELANNF